MTRLSVSGPWWPLLSAALLAATFASAQPAATATPKSYYRDARSYGTKRLPDVPAYVHTLDEIGGEAYRDLSWLELGLDLRTRYEYRDDDLRRPGPGRDEPLLFKSHLYLGVKERFDPFRFAIELQDSRRENSNYPRDDRDVNEFEFINLYGELFFKDALGTDALGNDRPVWIRAGRMAFELLDRRLIGSNQWRNTTNTFQGLRASLGQEANDWQLELFALQPLVRLKYDWDLPRQGQWFYGAVGHWRKWSDIITLEPYYLALKQDPSLGVMGREIHSAALRGYGLFGATGFDFDFDAVYQFGRNGNEQHRAWGLTTEVGYTFDHSWKPRLSAFYGYASGDRDPNDNKNERFERFFGFARPWSANDYIVWENLHAPKVRLDVQPHKKLRVDLGYSWYWLASSTDRWNNANLRDRSGRSGNFMGHEGDIRLRYAAHKKVDVTFGYAHFTPGGFTRNRGKGWDSDFFYLETTISAF